MDPSRPDHPRGWARRGRYALATAIGLAGLAALTAPTPAAPPASRALPAEAASQALPAMATSQALPATPPAGEAGPATRGQPSTSDRGTTLYQQSCATCHGEQGQGSQRGPALVGVGAASVDFQLSTGRMPLRAQRYATQHRAPAFSADDIDALVRHVTAFGGDGPPIPAVGTGEAGTGRGLYLAYCAACHSATGVGAALTGGQVTPALDRATARQVAEAIRVGPGLMPAFPATNLDDRQVAAIAGYVQVLQNRRQDVDPGGFSLARIGPVTEGVVAWVFGMAVLVLVARRLGSRTR